MTNEAAVLLCAILNGLVGQNKFIGRFSREMEMVGTKSDLGAYALVEVRDVQGF